MNDEQFFQLIREAVKAGLHHIDEVAGLSRYRGCDTPKRLKAMMQRIEREVHRRDVHARYGIETLH